MYPWERSTLGQRQALSVGAPYSGATPHLICRSALLPSDANHYMWGRSTLEQRQILSVGTLYSGAKPNIVFGSALL